MTDQVAAYRRAGAAFKRAVTIHGREQARGRTDLSVQQTRRMALAVATLHRAHRRYADAQRALFQPSARALDGYIQEQERQQDSFLRRAR